MPRMPYENPQPEQPDPKKATLDKIFGLALIDKDIERELLRLTLSQDTTIAAQKCESDEMLANLVREKMATIIGNRM